VPFDPETHWLAGWTPTEGRQFDRVISHSRESLYTPPMIAPCIPVSNEAAPIASGLVEHM